MGDLVKSFEPFVDFGDDVNDSFGLTKAFDPGKDERNRAQNRDDEAMRMWLQTLPKDENGQVILGDVNAEQFSLEGPQYGTGDDMLRRYGEDQQNLLTHHNEWTDGGDSAYGDLSMDTQGMQDAAGYFKNLSQTGSDPIAQAEYAKRVEQAERARRGEADAAVRALDTQGRGGSGATLLANLTSAQGQASDQHQAGLDAAAQSAGRRDAAAGQYYGTTADIANAQFGADQAKASGMDAWQSWEEGQKVGVGEANAQRSQEASNKRYERSNQTSDANTDLQNQRAWWEGPGRGAAMWDRQQGAVGNATGQLSGNAQGMRENGAQQFGGGKFAVDLISKFGGGM